MTLSKSSYVDFILANEKPKRIEGLLQERFLEKTLVSMMKDGTSFSFGWARTQWPPGRQVWCRIVDGENPSKDSLASTEFVHFMAERRKEPVIEIRAGLKVDNRKIEGLHADVFEYRAGVMVPSAEYQRMVQYFFKKSRVDDRFGLPAPVPLGNEYIREHLEAHGEEDLNRLLVNRILLNYGLGFPVDIDAIFHRNGKLGVIEYKRKEPAWGHFPLTFCPLDMAAHVDRLTKEFKAYLHKKDPMEFEPSLNYIAFRKHLDSFLTHHEGLRVDPYKGNEPCFGLDLSHIKMVEFCRRYGLHYGYLIWNHPRPEYGKSLLSPELVPYAVTAGPVRFQTNIGAAPVFDGLNLTMGRDSGSWGDGARETRSPTKEERLEQYATVRLQVTSRCCRFRDSSQFRDLGKVR